MPLGKRKPTHGFHLNSKKRRITRAVEEIKYDPDAREEYLTGFHKRKLQRQKLAREEAAEKERELRIATRKQIRDERKTDVEKHVAAVNAAIKQAEIGNRLFTEAKNTAESTDDEDEGSGNEEEEVPVEPIDEEQEYIDEDKYTSVCVEAVDVTRDGLQKVELHVPEEEEAVSAAAKAAAETASKKEAPKKKKIKKKKFRYESHASRKWAREKEKWKRKTKAIENRQKAT